MDLKRIADEAKNGVVETFYDNGQPWIREQTTKMEYK